MRHAVLGCIKTRDHPVMEVRDKALAEMALLLFDHAGPEWVGRLNSVRVD